jgi:hypothetical protein
MGEVTMNGKRDFYDEPELRQHGYSGTHVHTAKGTAYAVDVTHARLASGAAPREVDLAVVYVRVCGESVLDYVASDPGTVTSLLGAARRKAEAGWFLDLCVRRGALDLGDALEVARRRGHEEGRAEQRRVVREALGLGDAAGFDEE